MPKTNTDRMFAILESAELNDEAHLEYLAEECSQYDKMNAWGDLIDACQEGDRSTNPNNLLCAYLLGISSVDPLLPRVFKSSNSDDAINERCYTLVLGNKSVVNVHYRSHIRLENGLEIDAESIRPGQRIASDKDSWIDIVYPSRSMFIEMHSDSDVSDGLLTLVPHRGKLRYVDTREYPDIDVDFPTRILDQIIPMVRRMYGDERVAGVCTYMRFGIRSALKDVGRISQLPFSEINMLTTLLGNEANKMTWDKAIETFEGLRGFESAHPRAAAIIKRLQGRAKSVGTHASALIISSVDLDGKIPLIRQAGEKDNLVSSWVEGQNRVELSAFGFVKFDRLGLQTLDDLDRCLDLLYTRGKLDREAGIYRLQGIDRNWSDISYLQDTESLKLACLGYTNGCFQFDSDGMRRLLRDIRIEHFHELVAANALYRPSVLQAEIDGVKGGHVVYCKRKHGEIPYEIPEVLRDENVQPSFINTYGLMVYQEQVMRVLELVGGIPLPDCENIRKAVSKKKKKIIARYRPMFLRNAQRRLNIDEEQAIGIWNSIEQWAGYGFNLSHALAYAMVAMRTLYLKSRYPIEFFAAFMSSVKKSRDGYLKLRTFCSDAQRFGIQVIGADINHSKADFSISEVDGQEVIRFGLNHIKGIGKKNNQIVAGQPYTSFEDFLLRGVSQKTVVTNLIDAGAFDTINSNRRQLHEWYSCWRDIKSKGVNKTIFVKFLADLGMTKKSNPEIYETFVKCLEDPSWHNEHEEADEVKTSDEDEQILFDKFEEEQVIETQNIEYAEHKTSNVEVAKREKHSSRSAMNIEEFLSFVDCHLQPLTETILDPYMLDDAVRLLIDSMPRVSVGDVEDYTSIERVINAERVYGCMMPFEHPMRYVRQRPCWIRDFGETIDDELQVVIDGYVVDVITRKMKPKKDQNGKEEERHYYRIVLDDGYDRVMITCWSRTWTNRGSNENGDVSDLSPCDVIRKGHCVRLKVYKDDKYGFRLLDDFRNAQPITMRRSFGLGVGDGQSIARGTGKQRDKVAYNPRRQREGS